MDMASQAVPHQRGESMREYPPTHSCDEIAFKARWEKKVIIMMLPRSITDINVTCASGRLADRS